MEDKKALDLVVLSKILKLAMPYKALFFSCLALAIIMAPISNIRPYLITRIVDNNILGNDSDGLGKMSLIYMLIVFITVIIRYLFIYYSSVLGQSVIKDLRVRVFEHVNNLRLKFFDRTPIGKLSTRTINDVQAINDVFTQGVLTIFADILGIFAVLGFMLYTSWRLTLICILTVPFLIIATYIFKEKVKSAFQRVRTEIASMNAFLQEQISGMHVIQMFNAEKQQADKFKTTNKKYTQANLDAVEYYAIFFPVVDLISAVALALLVWWGSKGIWNHTISIGAFVAFPIYLNMLFHPIRMLADRLNTLQMGLVAGGRVFQVLENEEFIADEGELKVDKLKGDIEFKNVWFAYKEGSDIIKDISFHLKPGQTLALVGSTGSGKTTIINILIRFYEYYKGQVFIDQKNIRSYERNALRSRMAMVLQNVFLFRGTIMENITLRNDAIPKETVARAAKQIGAHQFIMALPNGYDFQVSEKGLNLSMGQRQLISFVRALIHDPDILILDEATSSIDSETEATIQYAIEQLIQKRTSIIIAHRLSTIRHADKIIVINKGEKVEEGTHEELLAMEGSAYKELYEKQFSQAMQI